MKLRLLGFVIAFGTTGCPRAPADNGSLEPVAAATGETPPPAPEPAEDSRPESGISAGVRPCDGYVERAMRCASEEEEEGLDREPAELERLEAALREECRFWLESGTTREDLDTALRGCEAVSCAGGSFAWTSCLAEALPAAAVERAWTPTSSAHWTRIEPRPIPPDVPACETYIAWTVDCMRATMGDAGLDAVTEAALHDGMQQSCDAFAQAGVGDVLPGALVACADVGCGESGADLVTCITDRFMGAVLGESAVPK